MSLRVSGELIGEAKSEGLGDCDLLCNDLWIYRACVLRYTGSFQKEEPCNGNAGGMWDQDKGV